MSKKYNDLLKAPQWKCKRKLILKRDNNRCTVCQKTSGLHVHHTYYYKTFYPPWEYPNDSLLTLCAKCHKEFHETCEVEIRKNPPPSKKAKRKKRRKKKHTWEEVIANDCGMKIQKPYTRKRRMSVSERQSVCGTRIKPRKK